MTLDAHPEYDTYIEYIDGTVEPILYWRQSPYETSECYEVGAPSGIYKYDPAICSLPEDAFEYAGLIKVLPLRIQTPKFYRLQSRTILWGDIWEPAPNIAYFVYRREI